MFAQLVKAQMAACVTILRELSEGALPGVAGQGMAETSEARPDGTTRILAGWQPGMEIFGWPGEKLTGFSPSIPNPGFFEHAMFILTIVAVNLDLPLAILLLDPSKTNFSGWRGAMDQARQRFTEIQRWFSASFHAPIYRWKVRQWMAADPALARAAAQLGTLGKSIFGHRWQAAGWPYIQPEIEAAADAQQEACLFASRRRLAANRGWDYDDLVREIIEDRVQIIVGAHKAAVQLNAEHGLELTWRDIAQWPLPQGMQVAANPSPIAPDDQLPPGNSRGPNPEAPPND
jgi:capsid protein